MAYFCYSADLEFYFLSDPDSLHCKNLMTNSSIALSVFDSRQNWGKCDRGLQLFGTGSEANDHFKKKAEQLYAKRFRLYATWMRGSSEEEKKLSAQLQSYRFYRFLPKQVKILDEKELGSGMFVVVNLAS